MNERKQVTEFSIPSPYESQRMIACQAVEGYFNSSHYLRTDGTIALDTIPQLVDNCSIVFKGMDNPIETDVYVTSIFRDVTALFKYLAESGDTKEAELIFTLVANNLENLFETGIVTSEAGTKELAHYVLYALPKKPGPIAKSHWTFTNKLMDQYAKDDFRRSPYDMESVYIQGDEIQSFDRLLLAILENDKTEAQYINFITELLKHRYGFRLDVNKEENGLDNLTTQRYHRNTEAVNIIRIWQDCDARKAKVIVSIGESEEQDETREPTLAEVNMRRVQKVRSNFQVLEILKEHDELRVARLVHRVNGITNFNRYTIATLAEQYDLQVRSAATLRPPVLSCLSVLPYADHNGAFNGIHRILNESTTGLEEIIVEGGTRESILANILRATKGTASRQQKHSYLYRLPFNYLLIEGHSDFDRINTGKGYGKEGISATNFDIDMMQNPELRKMLRRHNLIGPSTYIVIKGCRAAEDSVAEMPGYNIATTIKRELADVIAVSTDGYGDQHMLIQKDLRPTLTQTKYPRKANIVSIAEQLAEDPSPFD